MAFLEHTAKMAEYANLAYYPKAQIETVLAGRVHRYFEQNGTQAFCVLEDGIATVAFRGTAGEAEDWITDLTISKIRYQRGKVHEGFYSATMMIAGEIMEWAFRHDIEAWYITGHSLGAALATLFAEHIGEVDSVRGVYLFGSPRVGNGGFVRWYNYRLGGRTVRVVNNNDVVARMPPWILGYRHVGNAIWYFDDRDKLHVCPTFWQKMWHALDGRVRDLFQWGSDGIKDHDMDEYERLVREHLSSQGD